MIKQSIFDQISIGDLIVDINNQVYYILNKEPPRNKRLLKRGLFYLRLKGIHSTHWKLFSPNDFDSLYVLLIATNTP